MIIIISEQKRINTKDNWWEWRTELFQLSHYHGWIEDPLDYCLHIVCMVYYFLYLPKQLLIFQGIFISFLAKYRFFAEFKILTLKIIPLLRLVREPSEQQFAYSLYSILFLITSKIVTDLLENFQSKKSFSELIFTIPHFTLYGVTLLIILKDTLTSLEYSQTQYML